LIPNGLNLEHNVAAGHIKPEGGGELSSFGRDFIKAGYEWTYDLCMLDSDLDNRTNGQELGDPCCIWKVGDVPTRSWLISNPGDAALSGPEKIRREQADWNPLADDDAISCDDEVHIAKSKQDANFWEFYWKGNAGLGVGEENNDVWVNVRYPPPNK